MERHPQSAVSQVNTLIQKMSYRVIESNNNFFFFISKQIVLQKVCTLAGNLSVKYSNHLESLNDTHILLYRCM